MDALATAAVKFFRPALSTFIIFALASGAVLLWVPKAELDGSGVPSAWIRIIFLLSATAAIVGSVTALYPRVAAFIDARLERRRVRARFEALSPEEIAVIGWCFGQHTDAFFAPKFSLEVNTLIDKGIVFAGNSGVNEAWRFRLRDDAEKWLFPFRSEILDAVAADDSAATKVFKMIEQAEKKGLRLNDAGY